MQVEYVVATMALSAASRKFVPSLERPVMICKTSAATRPKTSDCGSLCTTLNVLVCWAKDRGHLGEERFNSTHYSRSIAAGIQNLHTKHLSAFWSKRGAQLHQGPQRALLSSKSRLPFCWAMPYLQLISAWRLILVTYVQSSLCVQQTQSLNQRLREAVLDS